MKQLKKVLILTASAAGALLLAASAQLGAHAFWQANATTSFVASPGALALSSSTSPTTLNGASGTGYASINIRNTSSASISLSTTSAFSATVPGSVSYTVSVASTTANGNCAQASGWSVPGPATVPSFAPDEETRLCARIQWSDATTASNGSTATFSVHAVGSLGNWSVSAAPSIASSFIGGPPPYPLMICTKNPDYNLLNLRFPGAPDGDYVLRPGSPSTAQTGGSATADAVADPGWTLSPANVPEGVVTPYYLTPVGSNTPIAIAYADRTGYSGMQCGNG